MSLLVEINSTETDAYEDLSAGDYLFRIVAPKDVSKAESVFNETDAMGQPTNKPETRYLNWPLMVEEGPEKGRFFYHRTMVWASPEKIAMAEKVYDPAAFTIRFLDSLGFCELDSATNKLKLKAELFSKTKDGKLALKLDKIYGTVFMGRLEKKPYKGKEYTNLTKSWVPKPGDKPKEEELF
jgi:hypothetical protein